MDSTPTINFTPTIDFKTYNTKEAAEKLFSVTTTPDTASTDDDWGNPEDYDTLPTSDEDEHLAGEQNEQLDVDLKASMWNTYLASQHNKVWRRIWSNKFYSTKEQGEITLRHSCKMWVNGSVLRVALLNMEMAGNVLSIMRKRKRRPGTHMRTYRSTGFPILKRNPRDAVSTSKQRSVSRLAKDFIRNLSLDTLALRASPKEPTMVLDQFSPASTILHEFGHAIGFPHEHQRLGVHINFQREEGL